MCLSQARDNRISLYSEDEKRVVRLRSIENDFTDEFEIVGEKGRGGSCIVYLAVKYQNGKRELPVLLKEFYPSRFSNFLFRDVSTSALTFVNSTGDDNYRDSFITARDCFINICNKQKDFYLLHVTEADELVEIQGFYELGESCYAVMRAAGGQSWDQISRESLFELIETSISVLHELSVYHDDNILHGDIKPENVYIFNKTRQHVRLLDFGSMQILSENSLNGTETLSYSEAFASPEVLNAIGKEGIDRADYYSCITKKSDLYSLAAVLYYKITGKFPPQKMNDKLKRDQRNEELSLLWEREKNGWLKNISASVMSDLARFFDSMLSWNPKSRFDIDEMEQRLKLIMKHIPPQQVAISPCCSPPQPSVYFQGRESEIAALRGYLFNNAREIYIYGHGGIGKSELAKKIATTLNDKFDFYWLPFAGSIKQTILDLKTEPPYSYDHGVKIDSEAIYRWNLNCLRGYGPGTVLIIDNFDFTPEEELNIAYSDSFADLRALDLTILFTCRHRPVQVECSICIDELPNTTLAKIMRSHYSGPIEDGVLQRLLGVANNNTLIISQMAKTLEQSWGEITPESLLSSLEEKHDNSQNNEETISYQEHMYKQIRAIFDISVLSKQALAIMAQAILFPTGGINAAIFLRCHDDISRDKIRLLELNGWLNRLPSNNLIVHPLIQEVCARYLSQKEQACADFLEKYYQEFSLLPTKEWMAQRFQRMTVASNAADRLQDLDGTYAEKAGDLNYQEGMYAAAVQYYQTYWKIYLSIHPDPLPLEALRIMDKIANCAYGMSDYPSAIYYESYGLALVEKEVGTNCVELLPYYINMGNIYRVSGDYDSAYDSYSLAMTLCRENQVDDGINTAALYMNLAKLCIRIGKDEEARQYGKIALRILYHHNEIPKTWLASLLESFAILDSREGNHDNELHHSEQAIKIYEATLGREHPRTAASYNNKASALIQLGQYDKALDCLLPAVHILEETLGPLNVSTATTYHNLARVYQRLNRKDQAVLWCERALTSREKLLGASDPSVIEIHELYDDLIDVRIDPNSQ